MAKLSEIKIDPNKFKGRGIRPWTDDKVISPTQEPTTPSESKTNHTEALQKGDKEVTKKVQTSDKGVSKKVTKKVQKRVQTSDKGVTTYKNNPNKNQTSKSVNKIDEFQTFFSLGGLQKKCIEFIYDLVELNEDSDYCTIPVSMRHISEHLKIDINSLKKTFARLKNKNIIQSKRSRLGRNGCVQYQLSEIIYRDVSISKNACKKNNLSQLLDDKRVTDSSTYSSSNINTTTKVLDEWKKINFESIKEYGFNEKHILQISKIDSITPDELQDSINYFAFDLLENDKAKDIKKSPVAFFMGILRGQGIYTAPKNYESPQARKLRLKIEQQKAEQEKIEKLETELINTEFNNWRSKLTDDKVEGVLPEEIKNATVAKDRQIRGFLREYFIKNYWDAIKQEKHADCFN